MSDAVSREEVVRSLRKDSDVFHAWSQIRQDIGLDLDDFSDPIKSLSEVRGRLADLIESAPVEPSEDARELADTVRKLDTDSCSEITKFSGVNCNDVTCDECYKALYDTIADRIEHLADPIECAPAQPSEDARELAEKVRKIYKGNCRDATKELGLRCCDYSYCSNCLKDAFGKIAYEIERIAAPDTSRYVELPVDAEGVPINVGDTVYDKVGNEWKVSSLHLGEELDVACIWVNGPHPLISRDVKAEWMTHAKPRTLDDILADIEGAAASDAVTYGKYTELAREAYELGKKEAAR